MMAACHEADREPRTNLFVMATIYAETGSAPVKLRNMSSRGALIESGVIPPVGSQLRLCRGSLSAIAEVIWANNGQAGLRFDSTVFVADWLARSPTNTGQQRVDLIFQQAKDSALPPTSAADTLVNEPRTVTSADLVQLRQAVESLANDLAGDPELLQRHMLKLQTLDLVAQALGRLAAER